MKCPTCLTWNGRDAEYCSECRGRLIPENIVQPRAKSYDYQAPQTRASVRDQLNILWHRYHSVLFIAGGSLVLIFGLSYYLSPITRLELYGTKLDSRIAQKGPASYLVGWQSGVESWTELEGRLDTPLSKERVNEISTLQIERLPEAPDFTELRATVQEWIRTERRADEVLNDTLALTHPSIAPVTFRLDKQGSLLDRQTGGSWRLGRALQFIVPRFPKGTLRRGSRWTEHLAWTEVVSDWRIGWQADLHWTFKNFESRYHNSHAHLVYDATLTPTLLQAAPWAAGIARDIHFTGRADGEAYFSVSDKSIQSNILSYAGILKISISDLARVPVELRVGRPMADGGGTVVIKIADTSNVQFRDR